MHLLNHTSSKDCLPCPDQILTVVLGQLTKDEQEVGQHGADQRRGHDVVQALLQRRDRQDELDDVAEGRIEQTADGVAEPDGQVLRHLPQEQRQGDQRQEVLRGRRQSAVSGTQRRTDGGLVQRAPAQLSTKSPDNLAVNMACQLQAHMMQPSLTSHLLLCGATPSGF